MKIKMQAASTAASQPEGLGSNPSGVLSVFACECLSVWRCLWPTVAGMDSSDPEQDEAR